MLRIFGKSDKEEVDFFATNDMLVVFDNEKNTSDIVRVTEVSEKEVIAAGRYRLDRESCVVTSGPEGRIFFYNAPTKMIAETERLAQLEYNLVLSQITAYRPPQLPSQMDWTKGILMFFLFVALIGIILK